MRPQDDEPVIERLPNGSIQIYKWVAGGACALVIIGVASFVSYTLGHNATQDSEINRIAINQTEIRTRVNVLEQVVLENRVRFVDIDKKLETILLQHQALLERVKPPQGR